MCWWMRTCWATVTITADIKGFFSIYLLNCDIPQNISLRNKISNQHTNSAYFNHLSLKWALTVFMTSLKVLCSSCKAWCVQCLQYASGLFGILKCKNMKGLPGHFWFNWHMWTQRGLTVMWELIRLITVQIKQDPSHQPPILIGLNWICCLSCSNLRFFSIVFLSP